MGWAEWLLVMGVGALVVIGGIILIVWLISRAAGGTAVAPPQHQVGDRALELARERLARGEIGVEEFEVIKRTLGG